MIYQAKSHQNETDTVILRLEKLKSWLETKGVHFINMISSGERGREWERERLKL